MNLMKGQILTFLSEKTKYGNGKESKRLLEHFEGSQASLKRAQSDTYYLQLCEDRRAFLVVYKF